MIEHEMNNFAFDFEVDCFEKADAGEGKERRIAGFVSTGKKDKQDERVLQEGLDFSPFLKGGWFNDNHSRDTAAIVGYPEDARLVRKGEKLPTGVVADKTGWFVEGYLLKGHPPADKLWQLANSLKPTSRRLGFSIEGKVTQRLAKAGERIVAAAVVKNVAITNCPVNDDTALEVLAKSLEKAAAVGAPMGPPSDPGSVPAGVGIVGGGMVLVPEALDGAKPKKKRKRISKSEALVYIQRRYPGISISAANRIFALAVSRSA